MGNPLYEWMCAPHSDHKFSSKEIPEDLSADIVFLAMQFSPS
jgi:hypothetical protein